MEACDSRRPSTSLFPFPKHVRWKQGTQEIRPNVRRRQGESDFASGLRRLAWNVVHLETGGGEEPEDVCSQPREVASRESLVAASDVVRYLLGSGGWGIRIRPRLLARLLLPRRTTQLVLPGPLQYPPPAAPTRSAPASPASYVRNSPCSSDRLLSPRALVLVSADGARPSMTRYGDWRVPRIHRG